MALTAREESMHFSKIVVFLRGWSDAGGLADTVLEAIQKRLPCQVVARMDMDVFVQASENRPTVHIQHGVLKDFHWPALEFYRPDDPTHHDMVFAFGPEPAMQWRRFVSEFITVVTSWKCEELLLVGSLYDHIFYDEIQISGVAVNSLGYNLLRHWQCRPAFYQGPASVYSAILHELRRSPITAVSLWAHVPFYLKGPHELLVHAVMRIVGDLAHIEWNLDDLLVEWKSREMEIEEILSQDPSLREQIRALKKEGISSHGIESQNKRAEVINFQKFKKKGKNDVENS
ncbi:MAG: PAC2 family protein [Desulfosoma sp.]